MSCRDIPKSLAIWKKHCKGKKCKINVNLHKCNVFVFIRVKKGGCLLAPVSEAKKRANKKWNNANYKRFNIALPKEEAEIIDKYCEVKNISKNSFFREAAKEKMERNK